MGSNYQQPAGYGQQNSQPYQNSMNSMAGPGGGAGQGRGTLLAVVIWSGCVDVWVGVEGVGWSVGGVGGVFLLRCVIELVG